MSTESVVINEEPANMTLEEEAASKGLDMNGDPIEQEAAPETPEASAEDRPEWLPEKFNSVEDMAKAYSELEGKMSKGDSEAPVEEAEAKEAVDAAGVDYDALSSEYASNGELTADSYEKLAEAGIPKEIVDQFIAGQEATAATGKAEVLDSVGGQENYDAMTEWASDNFTDGEIDAFNDAVNSGNQNAVRMAVAGLQARHEASVGSEPSRSIGGEAAKGGNTYRSVAEMMTDMSNPKYETDPAFRADVEAKLSRSDIM